MTGAQILLVAEWAVRLVMGAVIMLRRRPPATALAWLVVVAFVPFFGAAAYFLVGENRLGRKSARKHLSVINRLSYRGSTVDDILRIVQPEQLERFASVGHLAEAVGACPPLGGHHLRLFADTERFSESVVSDIDSASNHCHLLYYIFANDEIGERVGDSLVRAAGRGVACRVLVDAVGSKEFLGSGLRRRMESAGVRVVAALPVNPLRALVARLDLRNHRKLTVIDGSVATTGSHNLSGSIYHGKERYGAWIDASVRITGPAVELMQGIFLQDWATHADTVPQAEDLFPALEPIGATSSTVQVLPTGPGSSGMPLQDVMIQGIRLAQDRVVLTTPYFVPDEPILEAVRSAALRGVDVLLIVPRRSDSRFAQAAGRSHYGHLLDVGVRIHEFTAGLLHAKTMTIDSAFAIIGSANLDVRSFFLNFEMSLLVFDRAFASMLHFLQKSYLEHSERISYERWRRRGAGRVLADNVAKLMTPLL